MSTGLPKKSRPQRGPVLVRRQEGCPDATGADRGDAVVGHVEKPFEAGDEDRPPHLPDVVLGPSGAGEREPVVPLGGDDDPAIWPGEDVLRAGGAHVQAEKQTAYLIPPNLS